MIKNYDIDSLDIDQEKKEAIKTTEGPLACQENSCAFFCSGRTGPVVDPGNGPKAQSSRKMNAKSGDLCELASGQIHSG